MVKGRRLNKGGDLEAHKQNVTSSNRQLGSKMLIHYNKDLGNKMLLH
jgi:hypothetical protein